MLEKILLARNTTISKVNIHEQMRHIFATPSNYLE